MTLLATTHATTENRLPPGWRWAPLSDIARVYAGSAAPQGADMFASEGPPFIRVSDLGRYGRTLNLIEVRDHLSQKALDQTGLVLARRGTIIFPKSGAAIVGNNRAILGIEGYVVSHLMCVEPSVQVTSEWLFFWLSQVDMMRVADNATYPSLRQSNVARLLVPVPPLPEQKRIADRLSRQFALTERAIAAAGASLETVNQLVRSHLNIPFASPEAKKWPFVLLGDVAEIASGVALGRQLQSRDVRWVPYLRVANVKDGELALDDVKSTPATESEIEKLHLRIGDILLTEGGDPDKLGRGTHWEGQIEVCIHQNHIFRVRLPDTAYAPAFVSFQIGSAYGKGYFLTHAKRTTGIATINRTVLSRFPLLSPPLKLQRQIADRIQEELKIVERIQSTLTDQVYSLSRMRGAVLRATLPGTA